MAMKGAGGTEGGLKMFALGVILLGGGAWMFVDSVNVGTHHGIISRYVGGSSVITMFPLFLGIFLLLFSNTSKLAWSVTVAGLIIIAADVISGLRFHMHMRLWKWIILATCVFGGLGLIVRSVFPSGRDTPSVDGDEDDAQKIETDPAS